MLTDTLTLPPIARKCRFVFGNYGAVWGLTDDPAVAQEAREHGYRVTAYNRTREGGAEWEIRLAVPEPEAPDDK